MCWLTENIFDIEVERFISMEFNILALKRTDFGIQHYRDSGCGSVIVLVWETTNYLTGMNPF